MGVETILSRLMNYCLPPPPTPSLGLEVHACGTQEDYCVPEVPVTGVKPREKTMLCCWYNYLHSAAKQMWNGDQTDRQQGVRCWSPAEGPSGAGLQHLLKDSPFFTCSFLTLHLPTQGSGFRWKNFSQSPEQQR